MNGNIELEVPLIKSENKNKNDLIFFVLLITYILFSNLLKMKANSNYLFTSEVCFRRSSR